ncbi:hypothetical protein [Kiloniella laminariae]|uniref:hypothetical protein n=1 Tax=Kiloniella laminariae TaxID=454162 RepID=UPI000362B764|nr:hypothetical protein [Kiloniella laminariae]
MPSRYDVEIRTARQARILDMRSGTSEGVQTRFKQLIHQLPNVDKTEISKTWELICSLDYNHPGLTKAAYLLHPIRTASLLIRFSDNTTAESIVLALCHNLIEVGSKEASSILAEIDTAYPSTSNAVNALNVDRALQRNPHYLASYYQNILTEPDKVAQVKIVDKMDNIHILCLNQVSEIRDNYLQEIEEYIVPMAHNKLPQAVDYLSALIHNAKITGYQP